MEWAILPLLPSAEHHRTLAGTHFPSSSWPGWLVTYRGGMPARRRSPIPVYQTTDSAAAGDRIHDHSVASQTPQPLDYRALKTLGPITFTFLPILFSFSLWSGYMHFHSDGKQRDPQSDPTQPRPQSPVRFSQIWWDFRKYDEKFRSSGYPRLRWVRA